MTAAPLNVQRLLRIATLSLGLLTGVLICLAYQPKLDSLQARLDDDQSELRSDDIAFSEMPRLRLEHAELAARYDRLLARAVAATFLHALAATVRRHSVTLLSTNVTQDSSAAAEGRTKTTLFEVSRVSLELRGSYPSLLAAIGDLSLGANIVGVQTPNLQRDGDEVLAFVPITLYEAASETLP